MARRQNIERRRKQIRHYQARRRRRSPVWRAFLFWWAPALVCGLALAGMASTAVGFLAFRPGGGDPARYALPPARLGLAQATAGEVGELLRMGNARRLVGALGDADIGISLDLPLPEPRPVAFARPGPLPEARARASADAWHQALPPVAGEPTAGAAPKVSVRPDEALAAAGFRMEAAAPEGRGKAVFWVRLGEDGRVAAALRFAPSGKETAALRALRVAVGKGRGKGPAQGTVTVVWDDDEAEDEP